VSTHLQEKSLVLGSALVREELVVDQCAEAAAENSRRHLWAELIAGSPLSSCQNVTVFEDSALNKVIK
jgi:hypothetical protein